MTQIITTDEILTGLPTEPHEDAIRRCGALLVNAGCVRQRYVEGMLARNRSLRHTSHLRSGQLFLGGISSRIWATFPACIS